MRKILLVLITLWLTISAVHAQKVGLVLSGKNVRTLADVRLLDAQHQRQKLEKNTQRKAASKPAASNRFNNFHQRQYDFNEYEKKLLNQ